MVSFHKCTSKILIYFLFSTFNFSLILAQPPDTLWTRTYGGAGFEESRCVQQTYDNGYIVVGMNNSVNGQYDLWILKTDANGDTLWTKLYGGNETDRALYVQQTADSGYIITGITYSFGLGAGDVWLLKTDVNGDTIWTKTYGSIYDDRGCSVHQTPDGGYFVAGHIGFDIPLSYADLYLIKTDANGDSIWTKTYGGAYSDYARASNLTDDSCYIVAGYTYSFGISSADAWLLKVDSLGDTLWTKTYAWSTGEYDDEAGFSVQQTSDSGYIFAGYTMAYDSGAYFDVAVVKTDAIGDTQWTSIYGELWMEECAYSIQETSPNEYIVVGAKKRFIAGDTDVWLLKLNANGDTVWTNFYGGSLSEQGNSIQQTSDSGFIIAGYSYVSPSNVDIYLIKLAAETGTEEYGNEELHLASLEIFPNPFSDKTTITYYIKHSARSGEMNIYDVAGKLVKSFALPTALPATISWDGNDNTGQRLPNGVYFLELTVKSSEKVGESREKRKVLLIR